jgi:hypothetical protein
MDRGRAETHLRQLAEAELRRATAPSSLGPGHAGRLPLLAQALIAVGAIDVSAADEIQAELDLALAARQPSVAGAPPQWPGRLTQIRPPRAVTGTFTAGRQASWRVVPVGQAIRIQDDRVRGEVTLLGYVQTANGGRFTIAGRLHGSPGGRGPSPGPGRPPLTVIRQFTAADDKGNSYSLGLRVNLAPDSGFAEWTGILDLHPGPQHQIRWLDMRTAPGEPATRINLDWQIPAPDITAAKTSASPGELLIDVIAARALALAAALPQETAQQLATAQPGLLPHHAGWLGDVITALQAAGALPPSSPAPGQLAGLCARLGINGHGITAPPAADLPGRWLSMLTRYHRRTPRPAPAPGSWAATAVELTALDGARVAVLGLHHGKHGTILHLHAGGITMEDDWEYYRAVRPLPTLWIRDSAGCWHATRDYAPRPLGDNGEVTLELAIAPPLEAGTRWIDVVAAGQSAEVRARLPLHWKRNP